MYCRNILTTGSRKGSICDKRCCVDSKTCIYHTPYSNREILEFEWYSDVMDWEYEEKGLNK